MLSKRFVNKSIIFLFVLYALSFWRILIYFAKINTKRSKKGERK